MKAVNNKCTSKTKTRQLPTHNCEPQKQSLSQPVAKQVHQLT